MSDTNGTPGTNGHGPAQPVIPDMDLGPHLDDAVRKAIGAQVAAKAKEIAAEVFTAMLTPEVLAGMRERAIAEAETVLDPTSAENGDQDKADEPKLMYADVHAFVEGWVAKTYRREVTAQGSERMRRWCPRWFAHGEVFARFEAMWRAFEELRTGGGTEPSTFWLVHCDPHMREIVDPEGPFKYCSPRKHSAELAALPLVVAPEGTCEPGHYDDAHTLASGLIVPRAQSTHRHTVREWFE